MNPENQSTNGTDESKRQSDQLVKKKLPTFTEDIKKLLLKNDNFCDISIQCSNGEIVPACKLVLAARSEYFKALFLYEPKKDNVEAPFDGTTVKVITKMLFLDDDELYDYDLSKEDVVCLDLFKIIDFWMIDYLLPVLPFWTNRFVKKENCLEHLEHFIQIASKDLGQVIYLCQKKVFQNFDYLSQSDKMNKLSKEALTRIFSSPRKLTEGWVDAKDKKKVDALFTELVLIKALFKILEAKGQLDTLSEFIFEKNCFDPDQLYCFIMKEDKRELFVVTDLLNLDENFEGPIFDPYLLKPESDLHSILDSILKPPTGMVRWQGQIKVVSKIPSQRSLIVSEHTQAKEWNSSFKPIQKLLFRFEKYPDEEGAPILRGIKIDFDDGSESLGIYEEAFGRDVIVEDVQDVYEAVQIGACHDFSHGFKSVRYLILSKDPLTIFDEFDRRTIFVGMPQDQENPYLNKFLTWKPKAFETNVCVYGERLKVFPSYRDCYKAVAHFQCSRVCGLKAKFFKTSDEKVVIQDIEFQYAVNSLPAFVPQFVIGNRSEACIENDFTKHIEINVPLT